VYIAIIVLLVSVLLALVGAGLVVKRGISELKRFITPVSEGKLSPAGEVAQVAGQAIAQSISASFLGVQSGASRTEKALKADLYKEQNPMLGALAQFSPAVNKHLKNNPDVVAMLAGAAGNLLRAKPGNGNGGPQTSWKPGQFGEE
jgi:nitrogen fixation/metabolism regulation signal transduction histidine kinase